MSLACDYSLAKTQLCLSLPSRALWASMLLHLLDLYDLFQQSIAFEDSGSLAHPHSS